MRKDLLEALLSGSGGLLSGSGGLLLWSAGDVYIGAGFARDYVRWIQERSEVVIRLEGLETDGRAIRPLLDYIADIPDVAGRQSERSKASATLALRVLDEWERTPGPQFIEFFLESDLEKAIEQDGVSQ